MVSIGGSTEKNHRSLWGGYQPLANPTQLARAEESATNTVGISYCVVALTALALSPTSPVTGWTIYISYSSLKDTIDSIKIM